MRSSTNVWVGFKHVGVKDSPPEIEYLTAMEAMRFIMARIAKNSLAQRFDVCLARTKEEVEARLNNTMRTAGGGFDVPDDVWANLENGVE